MKQVVSLTFFALFFLSFSKEESMPFLTHRFIVQPSSTLMIDGSTNVNTFRCGIYQYIGKDTLILQEGVPLKKPTFLKGAVSLKAANVDCGMALMTKDFNQTIRAKEYPYIIINFKSFERLPNYTQEKEKFKGTMTISLGGTTKQVQVDCTIQATSSGYFHLSGGRKFLFSDFNLQPPEKMMGLIKIQQELQVNFNLVLLLDTNS